MNMLHRTCLRQFLRFTETAAAATTTATPAKPPQPTKLIAEQLSKRALIRVQGEEVVPYLQGLITNDMNHLHRDGHPAMFTMFLNNNGRVLYDSIIYKTPSPDTFLIECDRDVSNELRRHLRLYRVRRNIDIDCINSDYAPWVVFNPDEKGELPKPSEEEAKVKGNELVFSTDPRVKELGIRIIQPKTDLLKDIARLFPNETVVFPSSLTYTQHRYGIGVGEGIKDHPPGKCFPLESNCDFLHGVSFHKGCYVGQELTARVFHTGVVRKRLMPLKLRTEIDPSVSNVQTQAGSVIGTLRGVKEKRALALLRVEPVLNAQNLMIDGDLCEVYKPHWWPKQLPTRPNLQAV